MQHDASNLALQSNPCDVNAREKADIMTDTKANG